MPAHGSPLAATAALLLAVACAEPPRIETIELAPNPNPTVPLAAELHLVTDRPTRVRLAVAGPDRVFEVRPARDYATEHRLPVLGMHPATLYTITTTVVDEAGSETTAAPLEFETPPLPDDFPPIEVRISRPGRMEPGVHLVPLFRWLETGPDDDYGIVVGLNAQAEVVWYYQTDHGVTDPQVTPEGNILYQISRSGLMQEIDFMGNVLRHWHTTGTPKKEGKVPPGSIPIDTDTLHHEVLILPNGNFLAIGSEVRRYEDYPSSEEDSEAQPAPANVIGDTLLEVTQSGEVLREIKLLDALDPYRISHGSLGEGFWKETYEEILDEPGKDWAHANSAFYVPAEDAVLVSMNHQSAVFEIDLASGEVSWILGHHGGWREPWSRLLLEPVGDLEWPSNQHAAMYTPRGTVLLFDNGNHSVALFEEEPEGARFSRVVEYAIDEERREVRQVWSWGGEDQDPFYSSFLCDVDLGPQTGNVIVTVGAREKTVEGAEGDDDDDDDDGLRRMWTQIFEIRRGEPDEKVFEIVIDDPTKGWACYRSERIPSLYP